jgi:hypothetical protein
LCLRAIIGSAQVPELETRLKVLHQRHTAFFVSFREIRPDFYFPLGESLYRLCSELSDDQKFVKFIMDHMVMPDEPHAGRSVFGKSSSEGRRTAHACLLQLSTICEAYRREIGRGLRATPKMHPDYCWIHRCQRAVEAALEDDRAPTVNLAEFPALSRLLRREADSNVAVFLARQDMVKFKLVICASSLLILEESVKGLVTTITDMQSVSLLAVGLRSLILRSVADDGQTFSLDSPQERDRFVSAFRERFIPLWAAGLTVDPLRVNMRMRFHAMAGRRETVGPVLYFFGGMNDDFETLGQLLRLTFVGGDRPQWHVCQGVQPQPRRRAALAATDVGIFLFGGKCDDRVPSDDFLCYKQDWKTVAISGEIKPPAGWGYDLICCSDSQPSKHRRRQTQFQCLRHNRSSL